MTLSSIAMTQRPSSRLAAARGQGQGVAERSAQGSPPVDRRAVTDTLSEVLRAVRLTGAIFFAIDASSPWVTEAPPAPVVAPHLMPGVEHVIEYHVITSGSCWGGLLDEPALRLEAGDIIVFPQGDPHVISSAPGMRGRTDLAVFERAGQSQLPIAMSIDGGGAQRNQLICGFLGCDARPFNPLLSALPRVIHLRGSSENGSVLRHLVELAVTESGAPKAGSDCMLSRLSELLFVEVVRRYLATLPADHGGWFAGLRDDQIGGHYKSCTNAPRTRGAWKNWPKTWACRARCWPSASPHFVGVPPIQYLAKWRIQLAAVLLRGESSGLAEIAERVGYGSEAALSRAFKRCLGVAPALYRRAGAESGSGLR